jgi:hypothetical protein
MFGTLEEKPRVRRELERQRFEPIKLRIHDLKYRLTPISIWFDNRSYWLDGINDELVAQGAVSFVLRYSSTASRL